MKLKEFKQLLDDKGYLYTFDKKQLIINHYDYIDLRCLTTIPENIQFENHGYVYLRSLATIPKNIQFKNHGSVDVRSLTTIPEGIKFENHGAVYLDDLTTMPKDFRFKNHDSVYLDGLTTMPEGIRFENHGSVYLRNLTTMPKGIKFKNQGSVDLRSLTSIPKDIKFENRGHIDLRNLTGKHKYQGDELDFKFIDGSTMIITSTENKGDCIISSAKYFKGLPIKQMPKCFIAEKGGYYAHGQTTEQAVEDVNFKYLQEAFDSDELIKSIKNSGVVTKNDYRLLTGACSSGCDLFMQQHGVKCQSLPLDQVKHLVVDVYGGDKFNQLFVER